MISPNETSDSKKEYLAKLYEKSICELKEGDIIEGTVVQIGERDILVDIGYKSEGIIYKSEIIDFDKLKIGDKIEVLLETKENEQGMLVVSYEKARRMKGWQNIIDNQKEGDTVEGKVLKKVRGGYMVDIGLQAFLPASLAAMIEAGGPDSLTGNTYKFKIVKINIPRKNIVLSRKEIVEEVKKEEKRKVLDFLQKDSVVKGVVRNITDFGAFVDIGGGITGLLHVTDISWGRITKPNEVLKVSQEIDVKVLNFDKEAMKISLGMKQILANPWEKADIKYGEGTVVNGKVVNIMPYGVFVELEEGIEGLIHISEFSWSKKFNHPNEIFKLGDKVEALVLKLDKDNRKLSLGLKQLTDNPWDGMADKYHVGDKIKGPVTSITDYGAFIEVEPNIEGLVHISDFSWTKRVNHPKEVLKKGDEVEAMILSVDDKNRRIALGIKQLMSDPWDDISQKYLAGTICDGEITNITNFGMFVKLEKDLEGLLHVSEISLPNNKRMEDLYKTGDKLKVQILHVDGIQKKIALSIKDLTKELKEDDATQSEVTPAS
ncbi:30S ribosomal protein S1 [Candidatus Omnitrophus magneticus]|uniref:30S ribosomal protein S1 n=1 Tax=Candidatus Omnitrophus magneticus TaxID=1609969 RepID=A0A0F0CVM5_9BACT|nr:30S ribosomal protein S1 [Candidatus Omnitrophus magneticus]